MRLGASYPQHLDARETAERQYQRHRVHPHGRRGHRSCYEPATAISRLQLRPLPLSGVPALEHLLLDLHSNKT